MYVSLSIKEVLSLASHWESRTANVWFLSKAKPRLSLLPRSHLFVGVVKLKGFSLPKTNLFRQRKNPSKSDRPARPQGAAADRSRSYCPALRSSLTMDAKGVNKVNADAATQGSSLPRPKVQPWKAHWPPKSMPTPGESHGTPKGEEVKMDGNTRNTKQLFRANAV